MSRIRFYSNGYWLDTERVRRGCPLRTIVVAFLAGFLAAPVLVIWFFWR